MLHDITLYISLIYYIILCIVFTYICDVSIRLSETMLTPGRSSWITVTQ